MLQLHLVCFESLQQTHTPCTPPPAPGGEWSVGAFRQLGSGRVVTWIGAFAAYRITARIALPSGGQLRQRVQSTSEVDASWSCEVRSPVFTPSRAAHSRAHGDTASFDAHERVFSPEGNAQHNTDVRSQPCSCVRVSYPSTKHARSPAEKLFSRLGTFGHCRRYATWRDETLNSLVCRIAASAHSRLGCWEQGVYTRLDIQTSLRQGIARESVQ